MAYNQHRWWQGKKHSNHSIWRVVQPASLSSKNYLKGIDGDNDDDHGSCLSFFLSNAQLHSQNKPYMWGLNVNRAWNCGWTYFRWCFINRYISHLQLYFSLFIHQTGNDSNSCVFSDRIPRTWTSGILSWVLSHNRHAAPTTDDDETVSGEISWVILCHYLYRIFRALL